MAAITAAAIQAIMKLRIADASLRSFSKLRYRNSRDQARHQRWAFPSSDVAALPVEYSDEGLFRHSERVVSRMAEGARLMRLITIGLICCIMALGRGPAEAQLRGHGGPIRALAISADGTTALSGSFDTSAIRWSLRRQAADQVLRTHDGAVNAVAILEDGRDVTAGEDARIAIWTPGKEQPDAVLEGQRGPIVAR